MNERSGPGISSAHRTAYASMLGLLDEALCEFERWGAGQSAKGVMYEEINDLTPAKQKELLAGIRAVRKTIRLLRDKLGLRPERSVVSHKVWVVCSGYWESLVELESAHMKRYGPLPPALARELDALATRVNTQFQALSTKVRSGEPSPRVEEDDE